MPPCHMCRIPHPAMCGTRIFIEAWCPICFETGRDFVLLPCKHGVCTTCFASSGGTLIVDDGWGRPEQDRRQQSWGERNVDDGWGRPEQDWRQQSWGERNVNDGWVRPEQYRRQQSWEGRNSESGLEQPEPIRRHQSRERRYIVINSYDGKELLDGQIEGGYLEMWEGEYLTLQSGEFGPGQNHNRWSYYGFFKRANGDDGWAPLGCVRELGE